MGNRAVITTTEKKMGVYLHWNGGRDSVEGFLKYCEMKGYRSPSNDDYGWARLCQVIGNFFGGGLSVGIDIYDRLDTDNGDNGVYVIDGWQIVDRLFMRHGEQYVHDLDKMIKAIDERQPENEQFGAYLDAEEIPVSEVKVGDIVYMTDFRGEHPTPHEVIGIGTKEYVNGHKAVGVPYTNCCNNSEPENNPNNYIWDKTCRIVPREQITMFDATDDEKED